jgi:hypothetical protein
MMRKLELSPYDPPRAHWYGPLFRVADALRRIAWLDRIHLPSGISLVAFAAALFVPGLAFWLRRERLIAWVVIAAYGLLALVFVAWLGHVLANIAFGLMLALHATSIMFLLGPWLVAARFLFRLLTGIIVLVVVGGLLYAPLRSRTEERWLMPLRVDGRVIIVQAFSPALTVKRGDWVAYRIDRDGAQGLQVRAGFGLRPVLAMPGDRVRFTPTTYEINGATRPRLEHMPVRGEYVVPENCWFIWPDLAIKLQGNASITTAEAALLELAWVEQSQFVGKPFQRWFWRRQVMP